MTWTDWNLACVRKSAYFWYTFTFRNKKRICNTQCYRNKSVVTPFAQSTGLNRFFWSLGQFSTVRRHLLINGGRYIGWLVTRRLALARFVEPAMKDWTFLSTTSTSLYKLLLPLVDKLQISIKKYCLWIAKAFPHNSVVVTKLWNTNCEIWGFQSGI